MVCSGTSFPSSDARLTTSHSMVREEVMSRAGEEAHDEGVRERAREIFEFKGSQIRERRRRSAQTIGGYAQAQDRPE